MGSSRAQTCAVATARAAKRAALLFDWVYKDSYFSAEPFGELPDEIALEVTFPDGALFRAAQDAYVATPVQVIHEQIFNDLPELVRLQIEGPTAEFLKEYLRQSRRDHAELHRKVVPMFARALQAQGIRALPVYDEETLAHTSWLSGPETAFQAALDAIPMAVEESLSWEQILDFRSDTDAVQKYRRLKSFLASSLADVPYDKAVAILDKYLTDYDWAIRKHGITTVSGTLSIVITSAAVTGAASGASSAAAGLSPLWAAAAGAGITVAKVALWLVERRVAKNDILLGESGQVAWLHEFRSPSKGTGP